MLNTAIKKKISIAINKTNSKMLVRMKDNIKYLTNEFYLNYFRTR